MEEPRFSVSEFIDVVNQTLDYAYPSTLVEGEVSEFKINQGKWVFFNLKEDDNSLSCFMPLFQLKIPLEDGMKVVVRGRPKLTKWGKFSFTAQQIMPVGEGSIKKAYEMLKKKLAAEGLFDAARKRPLLRDLTTIGVISSTGAAGYADFCKIINARWGGLKIQTAHTQVQGMDAPAQIIRALKYFNEKSEVQLIAIIRGGGSADDLSCFNDEALAREIAASKIPVITGIGHEVDESLADLVADLRGSTPSNVAELITPDKTAILATVSQNIKSARSQFCQALIVSYDTLNHYRDNLKDGLKAKLSQADTHLSEQITRLNGAILQHLNTLSSHAADAVSGARRALLTKLNAEIEKNESAIKMVERLNPELVLKQGYSIISGKLAPGENVEITTLNQIASAEIKTIKERK